MLKTAFPWWLLSERLIQVTYCVVKSEGNTRSSTDIAVVQGSSYTLVIHVFQSTGEKREIGEFPH